MMTALAPRTEAQIYTGYDHLRYLYTAALREAETLLEILRCDFAHSLRRNPIHQIQSRVKSEESIREKLMRKQQSVSSQSAMKHLHDIAGLRVVLSDTQQVYAFARLICGSPVVELCGLRDYIAHPKRSGYRSLHLILRVPVTVGREQLLVPVEVQLRTAAMDIWASIEHDIVYKPSCCINA